MNISANYVLQCDIIGNWLYSVGENLGKNNRKKKKILKDLITLFTIDIHVLNSLEKRRMDIYEN